MFISDFAIKRPIVTIVSMLALVVFGLIALGKLQTDEFPDIAPPFVTVAIPYPGASPDGVEKEILDPVEEAISSISGVKTINGSAEDGFATIMVEFLFEKPLALSGSRTLFRRENGSTFLTFPALTSRRPWISPQGSEGKAWSRSRTL